VQSLWREPHATNPRFAERLEGATVQPDGRQRPLGIAALENNISRAAWWSRS